MFDCYLNTVNPIAIDMQDFSEIFKQSNLVYNKLLSIDDENPKNLSINVLFTLIELRNLSLFFLILVNGLLFDFRGKSRHLIVHDKPTTIVIPISYLKEVYINQNMT